MAFSTFVFDTLDVATRLGRYILQELFGWSGRGGALAATGATLALPLLFVLTAAAPAAGAKPTYLAFWTLFGASNQLLAALTLLGVSVWLRRAGRPTWYTLGPTAFVMAITVWALGKIALDGFTRFRGPDGAVLVSTLVNGVVACALLGLAALLVVETARAWSRPAQAAPGPEPIIQA